MLKHFLAGEKTPCWPNSLGMATLLLLFTITVPAAFEISKELLSRIELKYSADARDRVIEWQQLILSAQAKTDQQKLQIVNDFFNQRIEFVEDFYHWGVRDYWATPLEFLGTGAGDCEDFSIAKYFTLKEMGVSEKKLRLTYVKAIELSQAHMVLTYFPSPRSVPMVLDNLINTIEPASKRKDLLPVYSFNGAGLWIAKTRGTSKRVGSSKRLSLWEELKDKMLRDEF